MPTYASKNTTRYKYNFESKNACTNSNHVLYIFYVRNTNAYLLESPPNFIHDVTSIYHSISINTVLTNMSFLFCKILCGLLSKKTITVTFGSEAVTQTAM